MNFEASVPRLGTPTQLSTSLPSKPASVYTTPKGVDYLKEPGVIVLSVPYVNLNDTHYFLDEFDRELGFDDYLKDPDSLPPAEALCKFAGQLCYMSFGPKRTWNHKANQYFEHIKDSKHGSVLEHANFSFLCYGISRSLTHELVRHRAGVAYSQLSQRYVDGSKLRFVERPEFQNDPIAHEMFEKHIETASEEYHTLADYLYNQQLAGNQLLTAEHRTDLRKKVNQAARSVLPNDTETAIVVTMNARALRHFIEMRCSAGAEIEIRALARIMFELVKQVSPMLFEDYTLVDLPDQTQALDTIFRKV